jgi:hypothetical protein
VKLYLLAAHNYVTGHDDPTQLESDEVEAIMNK